MKYRIISFLIFLSCLHLVYAQNEVHPNYQVISLTKQYDNNQQSQIKETLNQYKSELDRKLGEIIGYCPTEMTSFPPASPLSNFLTDLLYNYGNDYCNKKKIGSVDMALLNFGGIRAELPAGEVTLGKIYKISPFDNQVVIISLKGSELKKALQRFTTKSNQPYSHVTIEYHNVKPFKILINDQPINDNQIYNLVTLDFIQTGGDKILQDINFDKVYNTYIIWRDVIINSIKTMTHNKQIIEGKMDHRVIITPQP